MSNRTVAPSMPEARVLVVDDELHVCSALARSLGLLGYRADAAVSGPEALEMVGTDHYDLMVLDIRMPKMDGVEVMQRAHDACPDLAIIILTGHASLDSAIAAVRSGAADDLLKPVSVHDLANAVASALHTRAETVRRRELLKTISRAVDTLRGIESSEKPPGADALERFIRVGAVTLDREKRLAVIGDLPARTAALTDCETAILGYLMEHPAQAISCRELAGEALGYHVGEREAQSIVRPHVFRLRGKLEAGPGEATLIRTIRRRGYCLVP
jgi:DNA-binding response OmpR family regulator